MIMTDQKIVTAFTLDAPHPADRIIAVFVANCNTDGSREDMFKRAMQCREILAMLEKADIQSWNKVLQARTFNFFSCLMQYWDGEKSITFTDGLLGKLQIETGDDLLAQAWRRLSSPGSFGEFDWPQELTPEWQYIRWCAGVADAPTESPWSFVPQAVAW